MCVLRLGHTRGGWLACRLAFLRWFAWLDPRSGSRGLGPASGLRPAHTADPATANRWIFSSCCSRRPSLVKVAPPPKYMGDCIVETHFRHGFHEAGMSPNTSKSAVMSYLQSRARVMIDGAPWSHECVSPPRRIGVERH